MKRLSMFVLVSIVVLSASAVAFAAEKPRIAVLRFTNHTHAGWWGGGVGDELSDMLTNELASTKAFRILERRELGSVVNELNFSQSDLVDPGTRTKLRKLKGAQYLVSATVSSFEQNTESTGGGISMFGVSVGGKMAKAYLAVDLKVIDVETGEIVDSRTIEGTSESAGMNLHGGVGFVSGGLGKEKKTPVGKAIRACIVNISDYLTCSMVEKDSCLEKYAAKEEKRRAKTRSSIDLDE